MLIVTLVLLLAALVCFWFAAKRVPMPYDMIGMGLFFCTLAYLLPTLFALVP